MANKKDILIIIGIVAIALGYVIHMIYVQIFPREYTTYGGNCKTIIGEDGSEFFYCMGGKELGMEEGIVYIYSVKNDSWSTDVLIS